MKLFPQWHRRKLHLPSPGLHPAAKLEILRYGYDRPKSLCFSPIHISPGGSLLNIDFSDIDDKNFSYTKQNILSNNLQSRIRPLLTKPTDPLIPLDGLGIERYFLLANHPSPLCLQSNLP